MSTGSLAFPPGHVFFDDNGDPVASGLLYFYRTGTSTLQNSYSDSTLDTANSNPLTLSAAGRISGKAYLDPSSGFDYRITLTTSGGSQIFQLDDIVADGADTATFTSGSFTGSITGCDAAVTGTVSYKIFANSAGTGKLCMLHNATGSNISGTSNTTAMTMTGLPAACTPTAAALAIVQAIDNSVSVHAMAQIAASGTTITFSIDTPFSTTGFTAANSKGISAGWCMLYPL